MTSYWEQTAARSPSAKTESPRRRNERPRLSVGFVLTNQFTLCAFANFIDVLRLAADEGDQSRQILCDWKILSSTMNAVPSSSGVTIQPNERLGDPTKFDYIVVVGGLIKGVKSIDSDYIDYIRRASTAGIPLVGICTGAFVLYHAGVMEGYRCCVSWFHHKDLQDDFDGLSPVSDQIFVVDRDRLTCSGGVSSAHLAAYLVEKHVGRAQASKSLHIMIIDDALTAENPQPGIKLDFTPHDPLVRRALLIAQQSINTPLSVEEIADRMGKSKRQFERRFQSALGMSPQAAFTDVRLSFAKHLLEKTGKSIAAIAAECGFCDSSHMSRVFRRRYGHSPSEARILPPVEYRAGATDGRTM